MRKQAVFRLNMKQNTGQQAVYHVQGGRVIIEMKQASRNSGNIEPGQLIVLVPWREGICVFVVRAPLYFYSQALQPRELVGTVSPHSQFGHQPVTTGPVLSPGPLYVVSLQHLQDLKCCQMSMALFARTTTCQFGD